MMSLLSVLTFYSLCAIFFLPDAGCHDKVAIMSLQVFEKSLLVGSCLILLYLCIQLYVFKEVRSPFVKREYVRLGDYGPAQQEDMRRILP